ncbi:hypothetical protein [Planotetraspora sp. GP83]|uniref:hypothetical protein n=1 Tax=Planotetraspora sp. GP83 TaxID=3156264 RepID=UPI0035135C66
MTASISRGTGPAVVVETGVRAELGRIASALEKTGKRSAEKWSRPTIARLALRIVLVRQSEDPAQNLWQGPAGPFSTERLGAAGVDS